MDAKHNVDLIEGEMRSSESAIQTIFQDDAALKPSNHPQYPDLHKKVTKLHQRWVALRSQLHSKLITRLASLSFPVVEERTVTRQTRTVLETRLVDTNTHFRSLQQAIDWCKAKLKQVQEADYGSDANGVKSELIHHQREHKEIDQFQSKVDHCVSAKSNFSGDELNLYTQLLNTLKKLYAELLSTSNKRLSDLETLLDFAQSAQAQMSWLSDKEQTEVARDWSDKDVNVPALEQYYESLMSELEKREVSVRNVMERGDLLLVQNHPGGKLVENVLSGLQAQWAHVLQLTLALETHIKTTAYYQQFYRDVRELEAWIDSRDELLNTTYSTSEFNLDEGERLLKGMQELREELNSRSGALSELAQRAQSVSPIKQRRLPVNRPIHVHAVCNYKQHNVDIEKNDRWLLHDNSALTKWRVSDTTGGPDTNVPGVVFLIPPPDREAADAVDRLRRQYERTLSLWQRKQLRMRQNMIFATIRVVRSWDLAQFVAMGADQRNAIRKALNEDAEKLLSEGDPSDPQLRRLRREMDEVNRLFDEFERRARQEEESKTAVRHLNEQMSSLQEALNEAEKTLNSRLSATVPRDVHSLEHMVIQHKDFETGLKSLTPEVDSVQATFRGVSRKSPALQSSIDSLIKQWNQLWNSSHLYVERLKCVEILLGALEESNSVVSELELKLTSFGDMPSDLKPLQNVSSSVASVRTSVEIITMRYLQIIIVGLSRERIRHDHSDLDRTDDDVNAITKRWNGLCSQLVERLRSCEAAYGLLENYGKTYQTEVTFIDEAYSKLNNLPPVTHAKHHIEPTKEKYKLCDDTLKQLLEWIAEVEDRLANQDVAQEDLDQLRNQINILKLIKEELDSQQRTVSNCLDQVRVVVSTGSEYLTRDEVNGLERNGKSLRNRYDKSNERTDKLLRRLGAANEELSKFNQWMDKSRRLLEDKERSVTSLNRAVDATDSAMTATRDFVSDVIAHQADLRFITMAAQKFFDESKEYLHQLNDFRTSLPSRLSHIEPVSASESAVRSAVTRTTADYRQLLSRANALADTLSGVGGRHKEYSQALDRFRQWFNTAEPRANKLISEPLAADPHALEEQLNRTKAMNSDFLSQGRLVDNLKQALEALLRSVEGQISPSETSQLEAPVKDCVERYDRVCSALAERCTALDTALVQSQGVEDALDSVISWLSTTENTLKGISRPASLHKERLDEQVREVRVLMSDIESHRMSVESVAEQARSLVASATNPRLAKRIETKMRDVLSRTMKRADFLAETSGLLTAFAGDSAELERWLGDTTEALSDATVVSSHARLDEISHQRDTKKEVVEKVLRDGRVLVAKKDVTDTSTVRDRIKSIETQWRELVSILDEKLRLGKARAEQTLAYEKLRDQVLAWLNNMETRVARLEPVAVHMDTIKKQAEELKPLLKEHRDYGLTIDKLFDVGNSLDTLARPESPSRRRSSVSPVKRSSVTMPLRRSSQDGSPSPTKSGYSITSPISPGGSSGFGSRRASQDAFHLEDLTVVQQELTEVNNRYSLLGVKLSDRQNEIDTTRDELRKAVDHLRSLDSFLDKVQRSLPRESLPATKEDADKTNKTIKGILEEMYEKQSLLESTKSGVNELVRRKATALGADVLTDQLADVVSRWKSLNDACKNRIQLLEDLKDLYDTHDNLNGWLNAKDKMMGALGPISSDPRMVQSQIQQVQVLREEFRAQQPQLTHLSEVADSVLNRASDSTGSDTTRLNGKVTSVVERWKQLVKRLDERAESLGAAVDSSREFDAGLMRLRDALQAISDQIDAIPLDKEPEEQLRKIQGCERQLEGVRSLLADAEAAGEGLCRVITDAATRAEIQAKLTAVAKQYNALQAKLDQRKAEIESMLKDGREFDATCARTLGWLSEELGSMTERLLVSADRDVLQQQLDMHEPIYKEVLSKEHEIIMLLDRARDRTGDVNASRQIENMKQQWDRLKREAVDRHTRLQTCMEHCRKYYRALESFIPWLSQAENKLDSLRPDSFTQRDVEKHLRDLSVWKKSGEFEHLRSLGETFLGACDIDKDVVKQELAAIKARWDKLNNDLLTRTSSVEEVARRLTELTDRVRDLGHSLQRCEDRLATHDALGGAANDPAMLHKLKGVKEDASALRKPLVALRQSAVELESQACDQGLGRSDLSDSVTALAERLDDLESRLDDRCTIMQSAAVAIAQFNERLKGLTTDLAGLEAELDSMKPPGRDVKTIRSQQDQISSFINKVARVGDDVNNLLGSADGLVDSGFSPDAVATRQSAESVARQLASIEERARAREEQLEATMNKLNEFKNDYDATIEDIDRANEDLKRLKPVGSEVDTIRSQQEEFSAFREGCVEPVGRAVEEVNRKGQALVQSAAGGVSTAQLEKDLERINDKWNTLKGKLNDRSRKLDVGLLQSGKFQEALDGLSKWLADTEEMVANQRPPSADYKVVKAQMQEQKFLKKMLLDRQGSMSSLVAMGEEVAKGAEASERAAVERQLRGLVTRFDALNECASARMTALEQAMAVAKEFQDRCVPVVEWLDRTEKKVKDMELVPTDEEKIQTRIREHDSLHNEILRKKPALSELTETGSQLMSLVGEDEATLVADRVQEMAERYSGLVEASEAVGQLLQASRSGLRHLVITYQQLQAWMEGMEQRLGKYRVLAVHREKLLAQMDDLADLTEEIANHQGDIDSTVDSGLELMKHISSDEAIQLKDKLDSLQRRYNELTTRGADLLKQTQEALPLVQQFHNAHSRLVDWMHGAESQLQSAEPREDEINRLEQDIQEFRPVLENINQIGPQLCSLSPGEGASTIEGLVTRDNRRFDAIAEQIQRKAERLHLSKQRSLEVLGDIDSLLEWFREVEAQLREAEPPSSEPHVIRLQLKEHKALNDDIASQKGRVRDVLLTGKKVLRESSLDDDASLMRDKMSDLRETMESVWGMSGDRLGALEQALGLAEHLLESHSDLVSWLTEMESHVRHLPLPAIRPDLIAQQQDRTEMLLQSIAEHKPMVDKLNKTGEALIKLVAEDEGARVQEMVDSDNARYTKLRADLKSRQETLEKALQESSQFSDKLEGMLRALASTADEVSSAEPVSAHVPKIRQQQKENQALIDDLHKREEAFNAVKRAAADVINKAPNAADPAIKDVKRKLERLSSLWEEVQEATRSRSKSLEEALAVAARFWAELQSVMSSLADLESSLSSQQPPAVRPHAIHQQQQVLQEIKAEIDQTKPEVEEVRRTGQSLMALCGEPDKPEVKKHIEDLDTAWDTVTALFAKREENLINAMEKAMEFHETLQDLLTFLEKSEDKFARLGPLGSDIGTVKQQIGELKAFKSEVDPHMVKVEALNRQAQELTERTSADQAAGLKESLTGVNARWEELHRGVAERNRQLENALLRLGQFQHALAELLAWIDATDRTLDQEIRAVAGDPQLLEVELAKLKVLANDIQAHQSSVDTLNDAGRQLIESSRGTLEASSTQEKLGSLNKRWRGLMDKAAARQTELEEALRDAQRFAAEIQDLLSWLGEVDGVIAASKPVGGLPETASEQLDRFMDVYNELESARPKVEAVLTTGQEYMKRSSGSSAANLQANLKTLKTRWDSVTARANDKKIKLEIALKEATEFHEALQSFVDWLTSAEKTLTNLKSVSRVLDTILEQIEEHKAFQKEVGAHRETMIQLDKKGTHLKYFSQKQDVILIKNLLISVQHRWERVVSKSAERTRALDHGYKEAKEFHDSWSSLMTWLSDTEVVLDEVAVEISAAANDPVRLKQRLNKHRETQKALAAKQPQYDATLRAGKVVRDRAPKSDEAALKAMVAQLKDKWNSVCAKAVDRQRKLEEALLYCGQFKDALEALLDWLKKTNKSLSEDSLVHGDLDTVNALMDQHKALEAELVNRAAQMDSVEKTGRELAGKAGPDGQAMRQQLEELASLWRDTNRLANQRSQRLETALKQAEELHKAVHMLLEWLSDAEMKLRFVDSLPDDELETRNQIAEHEKFMVEMRDKEHEKDDTVALAERILRIAHPDGAAVIRHWITIVTSRWEEVAAWARQRQERLAAHLRALLDLDNLLEELLAWLASLENTLATLEAEKLPDDIPTVQGLIVEHQEFMEKMAERQNEVDTVCKAKQQKPEKERKQSGLKSSRDNLGTLDRKGSRGSPGRDVPEAVPHIGPKFPPKGSKAAEPVFRTARARLLWDRWRGVWLMAWERQRRLQEHLRHLEELERLANFSWDGWRKRFLKFMNHKKSRLTDLFRKMDKNNDNLIPREDFIEGIIKTKFDTSRLEMGAVSDMFDHNSEGVIDWKEFIAALRPDWEDRRPLTEAEKIHDEVKRLVMLCTCRQKFRVFQVGEGKYRFGDSQKLRLVRILRSTVMVRVGGGWVALDEFLVKNDPCRAKGRTNIELREQFILADGVSQSMSAFKPKPSLAGQQASQRSVSTGSTQGPITKVI
ncbi:hypothetical protein AAG570_007065 [Ranatra chinensis]|uniref:Dystonin n=1 Tax=Ranatra chinensis TaxID=642074 RepID=A0ABD0YGJ5_9HEMI